MQYLRDVNVLKRKSDHMEEMISQIRSLSAQRISDLHLNKRHLRLVGEKPLNDIIDAVGEDKFNNFLDQFKGLIELELSKKKQEAEEELSKYRIVKEEDVWTHLKTK